ncbi:MAG TPA: 4-(cytidine 5'-diphospho)-2-C-methyl-D-erythritol kinase [Burkholderiaceae bacterium]|nr:4-(cytidine 5'-diphospho)-2-C-methyl-D-erythritol kinase [Burkholderiaceae bacterium]
MRALYDIAAPAKLNLFLHVVGRRADGYHLLQSLFVLIDWCDTLHIERRDDGKLARHDLAAALPADDLCLRAARALQQASGTPWGADISIAKHVPSGAGMGGGSSDAASTLLALNRLWGLNLPRRRLAEIGLTLGADVPFFIGGGNAFVEGIGEKLTPVAVPTQWLAVLKPPQSIETSAIFASPLLVRNTAPIAETAIPAILAGFLAEQRDQSLTNQNLRNDLQPPAEAACPAVAQAAKVLTERFGNSRMSGSGSAVFARAGTLAQPVAQIPQDLPPGWVARMCRSLQQHPLAGWAAD